ncbi:MAG: ABC transporter permease [Candidatus Nanopelagicaceae bacterium]|nr:ABC transporter permease [Candidatus Nanopelagicaceae bacterium]
MKTVVASVIGRTPRQLAWRRFRRNRFGLPALVISLTITFMTLMTPIIGKLLGIDGRERFPETLSSRGMPIGKFGGISWSHPLGIEPGIGHDLLARLLFGARISFFVALITTVLSISIGVVAGIMMGFFRGRVDSTIGRFIDFLLAFPSFFMIVALSLPMVQRLEKSGIAEGNTARMLYLVLILIFFGWPYLARVIRSQVLSIRERDYVMAARALGASNTRIIFKEILPNLWSIIIVYFSLSLPGYLTAEAVFSFLGLGIQPPDASWGLLISDSIKYVMNAPTYFFITTTSLIFVVLTFNLLGDAVRDALDPKSDIT